MKNNFKHLYRLMLVVLLMSFLPSAFAELLVTHVTPLNSYDRRHDYGIHLLRLALEKTVSDHGPYRMVGAPIMNQARGMESVRENRYTNLVRTFGYEERFERDWDMTYVRFPIHLGVVGYRVCFIPQELQPEFEEVASKDDLMKYLHGQGRGWADVRVLRHNGFRVAEIPEYESLFKMTAANRIQLFCRGVNEIMDEHLKHKNIAGLTMDKSIVIFYPLPRFYYLHKSNIDTARRIHIGLQRAYKDGSIKELWEKCYRRSIDYVNLDDRRFFYFESPLVSSIDFDYKNYFYSLEKNRPRL